MDCNRMDCSRRDFLKQACLGTVAMSVPAFIAPRRARAQNAAASKSRRPNIIFLVDDQHRWDALGIVNPRVKTPNLDRLAREGIHFDQAVCQAPMCVPSRYSFMLGLYPSQIGIRMNMPGLSDKDLPGVPLPEQLRCAGYQTAGFGKTHWSSKGCSTRGFEVRAIGQNRQGELYEKGAIMMTDVNPRGYNAYMEETKPFGPGEEEVPGYIGMTSKLQEEDHRDGFVTRQCLDFLDKQRDESRPLFLYLSFLKPHAGMNVPAGFEDLYNLDEIPDIQQPPWSEDRSGHANVNRQPPFLANRHRRYISYWKQSTPRERKQMVLRYWANCSWIDDMFGRVLDKCREKGILDNCLIMYTSDHGEMLGDQYYRFNKYCLYEASVRVPLIVSGSWLEASNRGIVDSRPAELVDILPTFLQAANAASDPRLPGSSLLGPVQRKAAFCEYHSGKGAEQLGPSYMWRSKDWKLIIYLDGKIENAVAEQNCIKGELYHLADDPREWNNLFDDPRHSGRREAMTRELLMHLAVAWGRFPGGKNGCR